MVPTPTLNPMANKAELSSIATALNEITQRVTGMADAASAAKDEAAASELFEAERNLRAAARRIGRLAGPS